MIIAPETLDSPVQSPIGELVLARLPVALVIWDIDAHCGEIWALRGCPGARGYTF